LVCGATSYSFSAIRDLLAIFSRLRPKNPPLGFWGSRLYMPNFTKMGKNLPRIVLEQACDVSRRYHFPPLKNRQPYKHANKQTHSKLNTPTTLPFGGIIIGALMHVRFLALAKHPQQRIHGRD